MSVVDELEAFAAKDDNPSAANLRQLVVAASERLRLFSVGVGIVSDPSHEEFMRFVGIMRSIHDFTENYTHEHPTPVKPQTRTDPNPELH